jgi:hypothetical protein
LLAPCPTTAAAAAGLDGGFPEIVGVGLRSGPLSCSGAHGFAEHRARQLLRVTLHVRRIHAISVLIPSSLSCTTGHDDQYGEMTQFGIGHKNLPPTSCLVRCADDTVASGHVAPDATCATFRLS